MKTNHITLILLCAMLICSVMLAKEIEYKRSNTPIDTYTITLF